MKSNKYKLSDVANKLSSLSISNIVAKINERKSKGEKIFNLTIGDFAPEHFPILQKLEEEIISAYKSKNTNILYPYNPNTSILRRLRLVTSYLNLVIFAKAFVSLHPILISSFSRRSQIRPPRRRERESRRD